MSLIIPKEKLLDWYEALSYAFDDVDLTYYDEEAREQVLETYKELAEFLKKNEIDPTEEMRKRGVLDEES